MCFSRCRDAGCGFCTSWLWDGCIPTHVPPPRCQSALADNASGEELENANGWDERQGAAIWIRRPAT